MPPSGSRKSILPFLLSSVIALLLFLIVAFHSQLLSTLQDLVSSEHVPLYPPSDERLEGINDSPSQPSHHHFPSKIALFRERPILEDLSPSADKAWERALLTRKGGFLWVEKNETTNEAWGISMFHALHCLQMLRMVVRDSDMMRSAVYGESGSMNANGDEGGGIKEHPPMEPVHIGHCVGYIAQHLTCAADSTIEPPWFQYDDKGSVVDAGVDGEGYQHQCRDASLLWEVSAKSENAAINPWQWAQGDTIENVFTL